MYLLNVPLKQHTPIIHFQHDQYGATLRATDLKNRLCKYLGVDFKKRKFQVKIVPLTEVRRQSPNNLFYFANINNPKPKQALFSQDVKVIINTYFDKDLRKEIEAKLPIALAFENFGTRNNKGAGSYFIDGMTLDDFNNFIKNNKPKNVSDIYYWDIKNFSSIDDVFFQIKQFYSLLKSNININSKYVPTGKKDSFATYYKSLLLLYFLKDNISWEKRAVKQHYKVWTGKEQLENNAKDHKFIRALLGTSNIQAWDYYSKTLQVVFPDLIKRIPSSLMIKVFTYNGNNARVYYWFNENYNRVLGKEFTFKFQSITNSIPIKVPGNFNSDTFLSWVYKQIKAVTVNNSNGNEAINVINEIQKEMKTLNADTKKVLERKKRVVELIGRIDKAVLNIKNNLSKL